VLSALVRFDAAAPGRGCHSRCTFRMPRSHRQLNRTTHLRTLDNLVARWKASPHPVVRDHSRARLRRTEKLLRSVHVFLEALRCRWNWPIDLALSEAFAFVEGIEEVKSIVVVWIRGVEQTTCERNVRRAQESGNVARTLHQRFSLFDAEEMPFGHKRSDETELASPRTDIENATPGLPHEETGGARRHSHGRPVRCRHGANLERIDVVELAVAHGPSGPQLRAHATTA
jgi:hypothetical protein